MSIFIEIRDLAYIASKYFKLIIIYLLFEYILYRFIFAYLNYNGIYFTFYFDNFYCPLIINF